jgi:NAD(P)H-flavin reductase
VALAPFARRRLRLAGSERLGAYTLLRVADPDGPAPAAGQFAMLAAAARWGGGEDERPYLPRACSYARYDAAARELHFLFEDVGPGTARLCELRAGEEAWVVGPLGRGFSAPNEGRRAILVGGGVGIAPLAIWQDELRAAHTPLAPAAAAPPATQTAPAPGAPAPAAAPPTVLLGFRDAARAAGAALLTDAQIATDDGSVGHAGRVTELLAAELDRDTHATVYACGPAPMLEAVRALCAARGTPAQLALESGMACGFGACHGCVVPRRDGGYLRVCVDGPVIDAALLDRVEEHAGAPA